MQIYIFLFEKSIFIQKNATFCDNTSLCSRLTSP